MLSLTPHYFGTYARNLVTDWSYMAKLMHEKTKWIKESIQNESDQDTNKRQFDVIDDQQIDDALNGPLQAFFTIHLSAYASIIKIDTAHKITSDDAFKESDQDIKEILEITPQQLEKINLEMLTTLRDTLYKSTQEHIAQWEEKQTAWTKTLLNAFKKNDIALNDIEIDEFSYFQPVSELQDRFTQLKLALPKLDNTPFDFEQYWILKATLAIQSALSSMQLPNTEKDVAESLKSLKSYLQQIKQEHETLEHAQKSALQELLLPLA